MLVAARARAEREGTPATFVLHEADAQVRAEFVAKVRAALEPYVQHGAEVRFTSACWMVGARA
jgi:hypothetical protein